MKKKRPKWKTKHHIKLFFISYNIYVFVLVSFQKKFVDRTEHVDIHGHGKECEWFK